MLLPPSGAVRTIEPFIHGLRSTRLSPGCASPVATFHRTVTAKCRLLRRHRCAGRFAPGSERAAAGDPAGQVVGLHAALRRVERKHRRAVADALQVAVGLRGGAALGGVKVTKSSARATPRGRAQRVGACSSHRRRACVKRAGDATVISGRVVGGLETRKRGLETRKRGLEARKRGLETRPTKQETRHTLPPCGPGGLETRPTLL